jgi:Flp pilus assembly protein TadD
MQAAAEKLARHDPGDVHWFVSWAYATRRAESIDAARPTLHEAFALHSKEPIVAYNLACYECQRGDMELAKKYLEHALKLDKNYRIVALDDEDLKALWIMLREV